MRVRPLAATRQDLAKRLSELEETTERPAVQHDTFSRNTRAQLKQVFDALHELMTPPEPPKRPIEFVPPEERKKEKPGGRREASRFLTASRADAPGRKSCDWNPPPITAPRSADFRAIDQELFC